VIELKKWESKKGKNDKDAVCGIWKKRYYRRKSVRTRKKRDLISRM